MNKLRVGITHGDINGVGYEVILKALEDERMAELCTPIVYGSAKIASAYRKQLDIENVVFNRIEDASEAREGENNIVNVIAEDVRATAGESSAEAGKAALAALERAVADLREGKIDVLVTAPINKNNVQSDDFHFPGHTEYLQDRLAQPGGRALMILCNERMRVALVTTHIPVRKIAEQLTVDDIKSRIDEFNASLIRDFGVRSPRIAVLSLNPHAGDGGLLGTEEQEIIIPAIEEARKRGILAFGPYAADGFFGAGRFVKFDGILAMYHDQGLAPFKALSMDDGINFTAGLPYVRTSPDHGTGYDIAGRGEASPDSMRAAIYAAIDIYRHRASHDHAFRNPLRRQYHDKGNDNVELDLS